MKIIKLHAERFIGLGLVDVDLDAKGMTLIEGENGDTGSARSNGAGKSSIFEGIFYALYGTTRRGLKADEVINKHVKPKSCVVALEFEQGGEQYVVIRSRKAKQFDAGLVLLQGCLMDDYNFKTGKSELPHITLTKGTVKDTQELLESIIKTDAMTFGQAVFFGQGDVKPFAELRDSELKTVFEQALGLTVFSESHAKVKGYISAQEQIRASADMGIAGIDVRIDGAKDRQLSLRQTIQSKEDAAKTWQADMDAVRDGIAKEHVAARSEVEGVSAAIQSAMPLFEELKAKLAKLQGLSAPLDEKRSGANADYRIVTTNAGRIKDKVDRLQSEMTRHSTLIGIPCKTCARPYTADEIRKVSEGLKAEIELNLLALRTEQANSEKLHATSAKMDELHRNLKAGLDDVSARYNKASNGLAEMQSKKEQLDRIIVSTDTRLKEHDAMVAGRNGGPDKDLEDLRRQLHVAEGDEKTLTVKREGQEGVKQAAQANIEVGNTLAHVLGNGGVKSYVFDAVTPALNTYVNEAMVKLDESISVEVSTVSKLKSGELREKFAVNVDGLNSGKNFAGHSGGEKQKVNLAIALGFNKLVREMNGSDLGLLCLDEPFEALDEVSSERAVDLLGTVNADNVFLITHNQSVKDLVTNRIKITKSGGVATVV